MSTRACCVVCGYLIEDVVDNKPWLQEFRTVYSSPKGSFVSGVGSHDSITNFLWIAPSNPMMRSDDAAYVFVARDEFAVMQENPRNDRHGFVLHDACWHLLKNAFPPTEDLLKRFLDVCKSLPFAYQGSSVCWGHDFGKLRILNDEDHYPWENRHLRHCRVGVRDLAKENPFMVPEIPGLLAQAVHLDYPLKLLPKSRGSDCFSKFPWEILDAIAIRLPTHSALNLRRVSKAFVPLLSSNIFWASRFDPNGDRGFMFEKWQSQDAIDWRKLYRLTRPSNTSMALKNRKRVWELVVSLDDVLSLRLADSPSEGQGSSLLRWNGVTGDVKEQGDNGYATDFEEGCRVFGKHFTYIPEDLTKISFSIASIGNVSFIAGIRLITEDGPDICLGFVSKGREIIRDVTELSGLVLAACSRGIRALQIVNKDTTRSEWICSPTDLPITERLAYFDSIDALEVSFDGYKIVGLQIAGSPSPYAETPRFYDTPLRQAALWYPEMPAPQLCLNEESFLGEDPRSTDYQPLFWIHFGGPGGIYLSHIIGVCIECWVDIYSIEFLYDNYSESANFNSMGRQKIKGIFRTEIFEIDGAGGERIESIEVTLQLVKRGHFENVYSFIRHGKLSSVKITTNYQRSFNTGTYRDSTPLQAMVIAPGTTITGLYGSQHPRYGIVSLGVISEVVNSDQLSEVEDCEQLSELEDAEQLSEKEDAEQLSEMEDCEQFLY